MARLNVENTVLVDVQPASVLSPFKRARKPSKKPSKINTDANAKGMMSLMISCIHIFAVSKECVMVPNKRHKQLTHEDHCRCNNCGIES